MICDFKTVSSVLQEHIGQSGLRNYTKLINTLISSYVKTSYRVEIDRAELSKWHSGASLVMGSLVDFYRDNRDKLIADVYVILDKYVFDRIHLFHTLRNIVVEDTSLSPEMKQNALSLITSDLENASVDRETDLNQLSTFVAELIYVAISRPYTKVGKQFTPVPYRNQLSPDVISLFSHCKPPDPCKHFCGRDAEMAELHELLNSHKHIFVHGIGGIGKSEFVKAYAKAHRKDYTNILYLTYHGSLMEMIADMDDASTLQQNRFMKNHNILCSLHEDTLLIIDNFNVTETENITLPTLLNYNCRIIFTTRCVVECGYTYELHEMQDERDLIDLFEKCYSDTTENISIVKKIICTVHAHTYAVELAARLLEKGLLSPEQVLKKLKVSSVNATLKDKIKAWKDNVPRKETYHNHIHLLFNLFSLSEEMQTFLQYMGFVPVEGIAARLFAGWVGLDSMDIINDLAEIGLLRYDNQANISLHSLIVDIVFEDMKPSVTSCETLIRSLNCLCLKRNEVHPFYRKMLLICENICNRIQPDDFQKYVTFLMDVFTYMDDKADDCGMEIILTKLTEMKPYLNQHELAVYYSHQAGLAMHHGKLYEAKAFFMNALQCCPPDYDYLLTANLYASLGNCFHLLNDTESAQTNFEQALIYFNLAEDGKTAYYDKYIFMIAYSGFLFQTSQKTDQQKAIQTLRQALAEVSRSGTENNPILADISYHLGAYLLRTGKTDEALMHLRRAFTTYKKIYAFDPGKIEALFENIVHLLVNYL